jgi:hypothetical protein
MMRNPASAGSVSMRGDCRARGGWHLVELMCTIGLTSIVLAVAGKYLAVLLNAETRYGLALQDGAVQSRLAGQFRDDAHDSISARLQGETLDLALADGRTVRYRAEQSVVHRELSGPGVSSVTRDIFRQSEGVLRIEQDEAAGLVCIVCETEPTASAREATPNVRIEAALGIVGRSTSMSARPVVEVRQP